MYNPVGMLKMEQLILPMGTQRSLPRGGIIWIECWRIRQNDWDNLLEKKMCLGADGLISNLGFTVY